MYSFFCDCRREPKLIDPMGYHIVGCKRDAHAIRLRNAVAYTLTRLFRSLDLAVQLESLHLFAGDDVDNHRPDITIQTPLMRAVISFGMLLSQA